MKIDTKKIHSLDEFLLLVELNTYCHHKGCKRKKKYLDKWGHVGSPVDDIVYCMEHQNDLKKHRTKRK